jgi:hypothetical protein
LSDKKLLKLQFELEAGLKNAEEPSPQRLNSVEPEIVSKKIFHGQKLWLWKADILTNGNDLA